VSCPFCFLTIDCGQCVSQHCFLIGDHEVICDPATALARARRLFPNVEGELVPGCSHDMCFTQHRMVDTRVLDFLKKAPIDDRGAITEPSEAQFASA